MFFIIYFFNSEEIPLLMLGEADTDQSICNNMQKNNRINQVPKNDLSF